MQLLPKWRCSKAPRVLESLLYGAAECSSPKFKSPPCPRKADGPDSEHVSDLLGRAAKTTEHVSDLLGRLWFMRPSFEKFGNAMQMHRGYWHYRWYFDSKLPYNYMPIVIIGINLSVY